MSQVEHFIFSPKDRTLAASSSQQLKGKSQIFCASNPDIHMEETSKNFW